MKKLGILLLVLIVAAGVAAGIIWGGSAKAKKDDIITIEKGSSDKSVVETLKKDGVISSDIGLLIRLKLSDYSGKFQFGQYKITKGMTANEIFKQISSSKNNLATVNITIPEGYSAEQIGAVCEKKGLFSKEEFLKAANTKDGYDFDWLSDVQETSGKKYILQGYLYPDTYNVYKDTTPEELITEMLENFDTHYKTLDLSDTDKTLDEIVTEASIIEKETAVDSERATIAGVIENRLAKNMRLQMCPTALYPVTDGMYNKTTVTYKDTKVDSPYNTYVNYGLPVGPICNPSVESIDAAAHPESNEYYYYHTKSEGSKEHIFTKTYEEHMKTQSSN